jgi:hypothetical protein
MKKLHHLSLVVVCCIVAVLVLAYFATRPYRAALTASESLLVGSWGYISPDHKGRTAVVYHFGANRHVREEHYYLTSASPTVPRTTMVGRWSVDKDNRLTVEPNSGLSYAGDSMCGWLNEYFDNGKQAWSRPILTRFYDVRSAASSGIQVDCNRSGGGRTSITMLPYGGDPMAVQSE